MTTIIPYFLQDNINSAATKLVEVSVESWKKEDNVVDDITCVVAFLDVKTTLAQHHLNQPRD
jgi:hypothetical protein